VLKTLATREREIRSADGRWYLVRLLPYRTLEDKIDGVVLTFLDIIERKRAEQALKQADRRKDEFLATLAHELRNPLSSVSFGLQILGQAEEDHAMKEQAQSAIGRQLKQLVRLVDDLLDVSRIGEGETQLRKERIELARAVDTAVEINRPLIEAANHTLDSADALALLLKMNGHEVWTAYGGPDGIEAALAHRPEVVLLDIGLPGMDGYEVAKQLRERLPQALPVALTGWGQEEDRRRSREAGFDYH
jgi:signal transduction histidine kinase